MGRPLHLVLVWAQLARAQAITYMPTAGSQPTDAWPQPNQPQACRRSRTFAELGPLGSPEDAVRGLELCLEVSGEQLPPEDLWRWKQEQNLEMALVLVKVV